MTRIVTVCPVCTAPLRFAAADCCSLECRDIHSARIIASRMRQPLGMSAPKRDLRRGRKRNRAAR
jgi:hypothetical protein